MYVNFQQIRGCRSVKNRAHKLVAKNHKLHKFATCNWSFEKSRLLDMHYPITDIQAFMQRELSLLKDFTDFFQIFSMFFFFRKLPIVVSVRPFFRPSAQLSVRLPSVEILSFRSNLISNKSINLKICLNVC